MTAMDAHVDDHTPARARALVLDDSRAVRMLLRRVLDGLGFDVTEAGSVAEGLERLRELGTVSLALVDWHMPEADGVEFVRAVRCDPSQADMRLIMVTSEADTDHVVQALDAGADEYVMKPFTATAIAEKLTLLDLLSR